MTPKSNGARQLRACLKPLAVLAAAALALSGCEDTDQAEKGETKPALPASFQAKVVHDDAALDIALRMPPPQSLKPGSIVAAEVTDRRDGTKAKTWQLEGTVLQAKAGRAAIRLVSDLKAPEATLTLSDIGFGDGRFAGWWRDGAKVRSVHGKFDLGRWRVDGARPLPVVDSIEAEEQRGLSVLRIKGSGFGDDKKDGAIAFNRGGKIDFLPVLEWKSDEVLMMRYPPMFHTAASATIAGFDTPITGIIDRLRGEPVCNEYPWAEKRFDLGVHAEGLAITRTRDCGFAIAGRIRRGPDDDFDGMVVKLTSDGRIQRQQDGTPLWPLIVDLDGGPDTLTGIVELRDGSLVVVGTGRNTSAGTGDDLLVARVIQPLGLQLQPPQIDWIKTIGSAADEAGTAITEALMGIAVAGWTESPDLEPTDDDERVPGADTGRDGLFAFLAIDGTVANLGRSNKVAKDQVNDILATPDGFLGVGYAGRVEDNVHVFRPWIVTIDRGGRFGSGSLLSGPDAETVLPGGEPVETALALSPRRTSNSVTVGGISNNPQVPPLPEAPNGPRALLVDADLSPLRFTGGDRFATTDMVEITALERMVGDDLVYAGTRVRDEGGFDNRDGIVREIDCTKETVGQHLIDMGGDETIHAMTVVYDSPELVFQSRATDFIVTGGTRDTTANTTDLLVARLQPYAAAAAAILEFTANGDATNHTLSLGDRLEINIVADADAISIQRLSGVGPDLTVAEQDIITGSDGLRHARVVIPAFQVQAGQTCASGLSFCGTTLYRLTVTKGPFRCGRTVQTQDLALLVGAGAAAQTQSLAEIEIISRYGPRIDPWFGEAAPSHQDFRSSAAPSNRCFTNQGKAWFTLNALSTGIGAVSAHGSQYVDPGSPSLILTDSDRNIVGWAHGGFFNQPPPLGLHVPEEAWFGHWGGWHIGDGRMVVDFMNPSPSLTCNSVLGGTQCDAIVAPYYPHHQFWDIHIFRSRSTAPPFVQFDLTGTGLPDPCGAIPNPIDDCDAHIPPRGPVNANGQTRLSLFFDVGPNRTPIPRACIPDR